MNKENYQKEKEGYLLRFAKEEDLSSYYRENYLPLEKEVVILTGSKEEYSYEEVSSFFFDAIKDEHTIFFLILSPDGRIIGESLLEEIDETTKSCSFRIALFHSKDRNKGIGTFVIQSTLEYAFTYTDIQRIELEVYPYNPRAIAAYKKAGFQTVHYGEETQTMSIEKTK